MEAIAKAVADARPERLADMVRKRYPDESGKAGDEKLKEYVKRAIERTDVYGIGPDKAVVEFMGFMFIWGPNFDEELSWAKAAVNWETGTAEQKLALLKEKSDVERSNAGR